MDAMGCVLGGIIPLVPDRATLRWMHREHLRRARRLRADAFEINRHAHINAAAACRQELARLPVERTAR